MRDSIDPIALFVIRFLASEGIRINAAIAAAHDAKRIPIYERAMALEAAEAARVSNPDLDEEDRLDGEDLKSHMREWRKTDPEFGALCDAYNAESSPFWKAQNQVEFWEAWQCFLDD